MSKNINARIALKRDTSANWTNYNPVLLNGELVLVDTAERQLRAKIGDGIKTYTQLPFTDEALRALITEVDNNNSAVVVTKNGESRLLETFNIIKLTPEEYEDLLENDLVDPDALYLTENESGSRIQPDWAETDETSLAFIKNKPGIATESTDGLMSSLDKKLLDELNIQFEEYILNIDYNKILAFDTSEIVFDKNSSSILGQAILGQLILG